MHMSPKWPIMCRARHKSTHSLTYTYDLQPCFRISYSTIQIVLFILLSGRASDQNYFSVSERISFLQVWQCNIISIFGGYCNSLQLNSTSLTACSSWLSVWYNLPLFVCRWPSRTALTCSTSAASFQCMFCLLKMERWTSGFSLQRGKTFPYKMKCSTRSATFSIMQVCVTTRMCTDPGQSWNLNFCKPGKSWNQT